MKKWRQNLVFLGICCALLLSPLQAQAISCPPTETWGKGNTYISVQEEKGVCPSTSTYRELSNTCNNDNTQIQTPSFFSKVFSFYLTLLQNNLPIFQYNDKASSVKVAPMPRSMQEMKQNEINTPYVQQVVDLVNQERVKEGLQELTLDPTLTAAAEIRAKEIVELFSHTRPNGSSCFTALDEVDAIYRSAGENIAIGQSTPEQVVADWMNSPGHRENILNSAYTRIGVAVTKADNSQFQQGYAWAQFFSD